VIGDVWGTLGIEPAQAIWQSGSAFANPVAALPSLHTAYPVLILCFFWPTGGWRTRTICLLYALAMSFTLVYTGEHYVADVLLGWIYAVVVYFAVRRVRAWLAARREDEAPEAAPLAAN
jgi:membrane-associated phospholipid phosphatase